MQFNANGSGAFVAVLGILSSLVTLMTMIFWLVVGWRAMRAHEEIASALRERRHD